MSTDLKALEAACMETLAQQYDDICWMDFYTKIASILGVQWQPALLPKEKLLANCQRFADAVYAGHTYDKDEVSKALEEYTKIKTLLNNAGINVTDVPLSHAVSD